MRTPGRHRPEPRVLCREIPPGVDLKSLAKTATYVGSPEHKTYPSESGPPRLRRDASRCDPSFRERVGEIQETLRESIEEGRVGAPWSNRFPQYVWGYIDGVCYEARSVNSASGTYKAYPLQEEEIPKGVRQP